MHDVTNLFADTVRKNCRIGFGFLAALGLMMVFCVNRAHAQPETGSSPGYKVIGGIGLIVSAGGNVSNAVIMGSVIYGIASGGTVSQNGILFKENLDGTGYVALHDFDFGNSNPTGLVLSGSTLFGVTTNGSDNGSVFKINLDGSGYTILRDFTTQAETYPSSLVINNGVVYGTAGASDGTNGGIIFRINADGTGYSVIHTFDATAPQYGTPMSLILAGDTLYGAEWYSGTITSGTVFKINSDGTGYTVLHNFTGTDAIAPSLLVASGATVYGMAQAPGFQGGVVFKVNQDGTGYTLLHSFDNHNSFGDSPSGDKATGFFLAGSTLYGCTQNGGAINAGNVFSINTDGTGFADLYNFNTAYYSGASPVALSLQGTTLYGVAEYGGANSQSVAFSLPTTGSINSWEAKHLAVAPDGTTRILWVRDDEAVIIWSLDKNGNLVHESPLYGPFTDSHGTWKPRNIVVARDGTLRLLWRRTDYAMGVWSLDTTGNVIHIGPTYGPYEINGDLLTIWDPVSIAVAPDGTSRVLWDRVDGLTGVWTLDVNGVQTHVGSVYGPYYESGLGGWSAYGIGVTNDGATQVSWSRSDNAVGSWTLDALGNEIGIGQTYGPYADAAGDWDLLTSSAGGDGTSRLLWTRDDGAMGLWSMDAHNTASNIGPAYGPYKDTNGPWYAEDLSAAPDGTTRVLWTRGDRAAGIWSFGSNNVVNLVGPVYGPY